MIKNNKYKKNFIFIIFILFSFSITTAEEININDEEKTELEEILEEELNELSQQTELDEDSEEALETQLRKLLETNNTTDKFNKVVIRVLDKITARSTLYELDSGKEIMSGNLRIKFKLCINPTPKYTENSFALLKVMDNTNKEKQEEIFYGWMFAASPSLVSLEHPIYDISVISCK